MHPLTHAGANMPHTTERICTPMTNRINEAFLFALAAHGGQTRKDGLSYIIHPFEVGMELARNGAGEALICAGLLHDTVEDAGVTPAVLTASFGSEIAQLVLEDSEDKFKSWEERKEAAIRSLYTGSRAHQMLMCADKLSNLRSIRDALETEGDTVWSRFNRSKDQQAWLFRETVQALSALEGLAMYTELKALTDCIFTDQTEEAACI